ncbi:protein croquemort-like [Culex pipiens pallens]|uniref:protein croquemort-like n=1 Tax=Culex pipiens pallens TaxID=42434 RepID=UPI0019535F39|nr:protein croquemort-like [Culex pipiens pallens]XP_039429131.1 protein croquemort-like [Culex pipiens pallens]
MCCRCSNKAKRWWSLGVSALICLVAIALGIAWPLIVSSEIKKQFVLQPGTEIYDSWLEPPVDTHLELYLWNWTNAEEDYTVAGYKPRLEQLGPYTFREIHERSNVSWNDDEFSVTYYQKRIWHYERELSKGDLENDIVVTINPILLTIGFTLKDNPFLLGFIDLIINSNMEEMEISPLYKVTASEILFEGYDDKLLTNLLDVVANNPGIADQIDLPPFDRFGWFYGRNESELYDGNFTIGTGVDALDNLGMMRLWNGLDRTPYYRDECGRVVGSSGELWPPYQEPERPNVTVFSSDICSAMTLEFDGAFSLHGVDGFKWKGNDRPFDNGHNYAETSCQCTAAEEECPVLAPGTMDVSSCKLGAPATVSYPHYYLAHPSYREAVEGMTPSKSDHEFMMALEPTTGIPLAVKAQLQVNLDIKQYGLTIFKGIPNVMLPVLWFRQTAQLTEELASDLKLLLVLPNIGIYVAIALGVVGVVGFAVSLYCSLKVWKD